MHIKLTKWHYLAIVATVATAAIIIGLANKQDKLENKIEKVRDAGVKIEQQRIEESKKTIEEQKAREAEYKQNIENQIKELEKQVEAKKRNALAAKVVPTTQAASKTPQTTSVQPTGSHTDWLAAAGVAQSDWACAEALVGRESGWRVNATNPSSGAYGLPQSLPASKMASAGADWQTNPVTQLRWMDSYVRDPDGYNGWCNANQFQMTNNWY